MPGAAVVAACIPLICERELDARDLVAASNAAMAMPMATMLTSARHVGLRESAPRILSSLLLPIMCMFSCLASFTVKRARRSAPSVPVSIVATADLLPALRCDLRAQPTAHMSSNPFVHILSGVLGQNRTRKVERSGRGG